MLRECASQIWRARQGLIIVAFRAVSLRSNQNVCAAYRQLQVDSVARVPKTERACRENQRPTECRIRSVWTTASENHNSAACCERSVRREREAVAGRIRYDDAGDVNRSV